MGATNFKKAGILVLILVAAVIGCWEFYLRSIGVSNSFDDNQASWAHKRTEVYDEPQNSTFFVGGSHIKFDVDLKTWESITGEKAVQLALVGTSPQLVLADLANDKKFKGKIIVDGTEFELFSGDPGDQKNAKAAIAYYKDLTPAQKVSFYMDYFLQSNFVFLESKKFSLNALLKRIPFGNRKGIFTNTGFPVGFEPMAFNRQNIMSDDFIKDTLRQLEMKKIWSMDITKTLGPTGDTLLNTLADVKNSIDKLKQRGCQIIFVNPPVSGYLLEVEKIAYPREFFWDKLLSYTNTPGVYFEDYPEMTHFICPEWSHLSPKDAAIFTKSLIKILEQKGWFLHKQTTALNYINSKNL